MASGTFGSTSSYSPHQFNPYGGDIGRSSSSSSSSIYPMTPGPPLPSSSSSSLTTAYNATPRAFVPHSAINLSVKTSPSAALTAQQGGSVDWILSMLRFCFNSSVMLLLSFTKWISCHKCTCLSILKHSVETLLQPSTLDLSVSGEGGSFMTSPPAAAAAASGSQILDLTRSDSGYGSSSPRTSTTSAPSSSAAAKKSKVEQTEPVDFSSGQQAQQLSFASRSTGTFDDLSRYRSPGRQFNSIKSFGRF